ncbi:MAG: hypothetical protein JW947_09430 [Sedimentisphaerales bacterium]|nr:hypothetical protein [Sedimentisphaerales bacterium]
MVLPYMMSSSPVLVNREAAEQQTTKKMTPKRVVLFCFLLLAFLLVSYAGYCLWMADRNTPVWKALKLDAVAKLWENRKNAVMGKKIAEKKLGTVTAILHSEENSCALINQDLVHEGDITNGVKVVKINRDEVEFEKDGQKWTQKILANPNPAW